MKLLINRELSDGQIAKIRAVSDELDLVSATSNERMLEEVTDAEIIYGFFNRELFFRAKKLKWVQVWSAGVDAILFPEFIESNIILTSAKGHVGIHLADHAFALLLALIRGIHRAVREPTWDNRMEIRAKSVELDGGTMGIIGLGGTGIEVAKRAIGFGMRVIAIDPENVVKPDYVEQLWKPDGFHRLLEQSDVVVICAPLTKETHGMFGRTEFQKMKSTSFLINVTRGKIVDGDALLEALEQGLIAGAGLDVTPDEPLPPDNPLWKMENVIVTPHASGGSPHREDRSVALFCENLKRFLKDERLMSVIDKRKGY